MARELQFPYHPHVTVAHGIAEEAMDRAFAELADYEAGWPCTGFALYEQGADGVWRKLREFAFGGTVRRCRRRPTHVAARPPPGQVAARWNRVEPGNEHYHGPAFTGVQGSPWTG